METDKKLPQIPIDVFTLLLEFANRQREAGSRANLAGNSIPADAPESLSVSGEKPKRQARNVAPARGIANRGVQGGERRIG